MLCCHCVQLVCEANSVFRSSVQKVKHHAVKACAGRRLSQFLYYPRLCVELHFLGTLPREKYLRCPMWVGTSGGVEKEKSPVHEGNYVLVVQRTQDFTPGSIPPQQLHLFIYWLSWVVVYLSSTCLTINCLHFLFKYAFFPFILVFTLDCFNL